MEQIIQIIVDVVLFLFLAGCILTVFGSNVEKGVRQAGLLGAVVVFVLLMGAMSAVIIPPGNVGVVAAFGQVQNETLPPGIHFRIPVVNVIHTINTRVQPHEFKEIDAASSEYQTVKLTGVMNYHIDGSSAADLYQRVGDDFADKILDPAFNDYIKSVVPNYSIGTILGKRDEIRQQAKSDLQANLSQYHIIVDDIYIANIAFSPEYEAAIEAKQVAQQQVETEKQVTQQRIQQAQQQIEQAKGNAQSAIENAKGQATANDLLNASLSEKVLLNLYIQKLAPGIKTLVIPSGSGTIFNLGDLLNGAAPTTTP